MRRTSSLLVNLLVLGTAAAAMAQTTGDPMAPADPNAPPAATPNVSETVEPAAAGPLTKEGWSTKVVDRPIALSAGMLEVGLPVVTNMSEKAVGEPVSVPLAVYFGVTDTFQLSLHHGTGLCLSGEDVCAKAYNDVGLRGTYSLSGRGSSFELAAFAQLDLLNISEGTARALIGPYINWVLGTSAVILSNPGLSIGLTDREVMGAAPNKEALLWPVYAYFQATDNIAPYLFTGLFGAFDGFGDGYTIPAGLGVFYGINNRIDVVAEFDFTNLVGKDGSADGRTFILQLNVRPL